MKGAIVTGGASGIGRAAVERLCRGDWAVTVADRDTAARDMVDALRLVGATTQFIEVDVSSESDVAAMLAGHLEAFGRLDGAINSAGVPQRAVPVFDLDAADWDRATAINLRGMFLCVKHQAAAMVRAKSGGSIVAVSSAAATKGLINSADYCAAKAGVTGLVRAAALDCAAHNVRVNALLPGATDTPLARASATANPGLADWVRVPLARMASPDEIAATAVYLLSEDAAYITGASIAVDGGMTAA